MQKAPPKPDKEKPLWISKSEFRKVHRRDFHIEFGTQRMAQYAWGVLPSAGRIGTCEPLKLFQATDDKCIYDPLAYWLMATGCLWIPDTEEWRSGGVEELRSGFKQAGHWGRTAFVMGCWTITTVEGCEDFKVEQTDRGGFTRPSSNLQNVGIHAHTHTHTRTHSHTLINDSIIIYIKYLVSSHSYFSNFLFFLHK